MINLNNTQAEGTSDSKATNVIFGTILTTLDWASHNLRTALVFVVIIVALCGYGYYKINQVVSNANSVIKQTQMKADAERRALEARIAKAERPLTSKAWDATANTATSVGGGVRDGACFVGRKTSEGGSWLYRTLWKSWEVRKTQATN